LGGEQKKKIGSPEGPPNPKTAYPQKKNLHPKKNPPGGIPREELKGRTLFEKNGKNKLKKFTPKM